jgi:WD40 repeat protein
MLTLSAAVGVGGGILRAAPAKPLSASPAQNPGAGKPVTVDDDPLPEGVIARLGTSRFRHAGQIWCLDFSPDGKTLVSAGSDRLVRLWDARTGKPGRVLADHLGAIDGVAFSPDGTKVAVTLQEPQSNTIRVFDAATGVKRLRIELGSHLLITFGGGPVAFSPDGKALAGISDPDDVRLWDSKSGKVKCELGRHGTGNTELVNRLVFAPDDKILASSSQAGTIRLWDVARKKSLHVLISADTEVSGIVFSRDGKWLISGGGTRGTAGAIRIWDVATGKQLRVLEDPGSRLRPFGGPESRWPHASVELREQSSLVGLGPRQTRARATRFGTKSPSNGVEHPFFTGR